MTTRARVIAIDGPSGAGKGTVARTLAARLAYTHVDTGAMYRAVAWRARELGVDLADAEAVARIASQAVFGLATRIVVDGHDVTAAIRTQEIDAAAAAIARLPEVRRVLVDRQRAYAGQGSVVMEGRDIGTVVFPNADLKVYLDASPDERARRRGADAARAASRDGHEPALVARALEARDTADRTRAVSPLSVAPDAHYIDTTGMSIEQVVGQVLALAANIH